MDKTDNVALNGWEAGKSGIILIIEADNIMYNAKAHQLNDQSLR
ncbi:hypothetical protein C900_00902 [Fulvivirga imtechensis AK7]|uniref:Uncharacterized protein n=1 Tax=Fulvivirga imtechensis AK7 TaxID=1237149 RepID=L8JV85_9BACT|nr:hypothetical protein C900_00902 [Fulvivirga imtechensis AK7]